jgi:hypothetical protein
MSESKGQKALKESNLMVPVDEYLNIAIQMAVMSAFKQFESQREMTCPIWKKFRTVLITAIIITGVLTGSMGEILPILGKWISKL